MSLKREEIIIGGLSTRGACSAAPRTGALVMNAGCLLGGMGLKRGRYQQWVEVRCVELTQQLSI